MQDLYLFDLIKNSIDKTTEDGAKQNYTNQELKQNLITESLLKGDYALLRRQNIVEVVYNRLANKDLQFVNIFQLTDEIMEEVFYE